MKTRNLSDLSVLMWALLALGPQLSSFAQDTAFTYQGRLSDNGTPANGIYDFIFAVFDATSGGSGVDSPINIDGISVSNGLFVVALNYGSSPFTGEQRWLEISVSTNLAGVFATLAPRQEITRAPYAIFANISGTVINGAIENRQLAVNAVGPTNIQNNAVNAGHIASGQVVKSLNGLTDAVSLTQGANVTISTVGNSLQISAPAGGLILPFSGAASSSGSIFTLTNSGTGPAAVFLGNVGISTASPDRPLAIEGLGPAEEWISFRSNGVTRWHLNNRNSGLNLAETGVADGRLFVARGGNVGLGTEAPQARLDVRGDIRLGPSGQFRATSGEENLRIVRGFVAGDGATIAGSGFTVTHSGNGDYLITFTPPFAGTPTVTASPEFTPMLNPGRGAMADNPTGNNVNIVMWRPNAIESAILVDTPFHFIAVGPR